MTSADPVADEIAAVLGETALMPRRTIGRIVDRLGATAALGLLDETRRIEVSGGMLTNDGGRRRTPGGVFFALVRAQLQAEGRSADLKAIFPPPARRPAAQPPRPSLPQQAVRGPLRPRRKGALASSAAPQVPPPGPHNPALVQAALDRHLGTPPDLYRTSINPVAAVVTLAFHFPAVAQDRYAAALSRVREETGVELRIVPQPHQGALMAAARAAFPPDVVLKVSIYQAQQTVAVSVAAHPDAAIVAAAQEAFAAQTGWALEIRPSDEDVALPVVTPGARMEMNTVLQLARELLPPETGLMRVGADVAGGALTLRFAFPDKAREQQADTLAELAQRSGWEVKLYPEAHQAALEALARTLLAAAGVALRRAALYREQRLVRVWLDAAADAEVFSGAAAAFAAQSGWTLQRAEA